MVETSEVRQARTSQDGTRLKQLSGHRHAAVREAVARNPRASAELLQTLVADKSHLVRYAVAENPSTKIFPIALNAPDPGVRVILAQRQDLPPEVLQSLLADERAVRVSLAANSRDPEVLSRLSRDDDKWVRASVALSRALPLCDLEDLAKDRLAEVRRVVAQSKRLSAATVLELARDRSKDVRYFTLEEHRVPEVARLLVDDSDPEISHLARAILLLPQEVEDEQCCGERRGPKL